VKERKIKRNIGPDSYQVKKRLTRPIIEIRIDVKDDWLTTQKDPTPQKIIKVKRTLLDILL
jgi:hypothetical protein